MRDVPRARFVPAEHVDLAALDEPIPIGHQHVTTQPSLVAAMIEALDLRRELVVLEVGTGLGYQTALSARLVRFVWSIEWWPDLAAAARTNLEVAGIANVEVITGDGSMGLQQHAPFDAIIVSAAFPHVPPPLVQQLAPGGRLVQPIGRGGDEEVTLFERQDHALRAFAWSHSPVSSAWPAPRNSTPDRYPCADPQQAANPQRARIRPSRSSPASFVDEPIQQAVHEEARFAL